VVSPPATPASDSQPVRIVPKGLRSFDAHDADFFLELLPGPRDRDGLPDSIRFWKTRIEERDPENTFSVGLLYGPSGCGKSSLVKAGLLPRLSDKVLTVYVEATAEETETRLLNGLRKRCPGLPSNVGLKETLTALRRGQGIPVGKKVLLVLDQFEQWLHARKDEENSELVQALRQCDGGRVQCLVMVRDDFWLGVSRFVRDVEVDLVPDRNIALVDLFDLDHARKVLGAFGRAFGKLPDKPHETTKEQKEFLTQAVAGLAQEKKVICVRLALFAEMMKSKPWASGTLKEVGGTEGVGVTFLEDTFSATLANPKHRLHQKAARAVLKALLPEAGTDIKGHLRSHTELLAASGYTNRPKDFEDLLRILDSEIRLLTPTDPEGKEGAENSPSPVQPGAKYYQLTHDYLVHSLRDWLTRKQKETRRGRAELLLADRASVWNARPERRQLPSLLQWLQLRWFTRKKNWTPPQQKMMHKAARYHLTRGVAVVAVLLLLLGIGWEIHGRVRSQASLDNLLTAPTENVPEVVAKMSSYRRWLDEPLRKAYAEAQAKGDQRKQLHASLALLPVDSGQVEYLYGRLLTAEPQEVIVLGEFLRPHAGTLDQRLWKVLEDVKSDPGQRLRAACALAGYAEDDNRWQEVNKDVAARLIAENAFVLGKWAEALRPVSRHLLPPLAALLVEESRGTAERRTLTRLYADLAKGVPAAFVPLEQLLVAKATAQGDLKARLDLVRQQANAAVALAALGRWEKVWPLLRHVPDPTLRSYLIDRLGPGGVEARAVVDRLSPEREPNVSVRRALLLALGEFDEDRMPPHARAALVPRLLELYQEDPDPGIHGATRWLLRQWQQQRKVEAIDEERRGRQRPEGRNWYVNGQGQTMVLVPPGEFTTMYNFGKQQKVGIAYRFALAAREVTVAEFRRSARSPARSRDHLCNKEIAPTEDCPAHGVSWYAAAEYCNWLSEQEGIAKEEWCYEPNEQGEYAAGMKVKAHALSLSGYRLPTVEEWEYACRAGSVTDWSMGDVEELLRKYGWYAANAGQRTYPVGLLRPNDFGLFDMHGNIWEWCQNRLNDFTDKRDPQKEDKVDNRSHRSLRGGAFNYYALNLRSGSRIHNVPAARSYVTGFRPARTFR
jgi:formylglycine-generating enzyme required for sulfatase activity